MFSSILMYKMRLIIFGIKTAIFVKYKYYYYYFLFIENFIILFFLFLNFYFPFLKHLKRFSIDCSKNRRDKERKEP